MHFRKFLARSLPALLLCFVWLSGAPSASAEGDSVDALFEMLQTASPDEARDIEQRIVEAWSKSGSPTADLLLQRGRKAMSERRYAEAAAHLGALTGLAPGFAEGWNARATLYYLMGKHELSVYAIGKTLALNPRHFGALTGLGMIFERQGDTERALEAYLKVMSLSPNRPHIGEAVRRLSRTAAGTSV